MLIFIWIRKRKIVSSVYKIILYKLKYLRRVSVLKMASSLSSWFEFLIALFTLSKDQSGILCLCLNASSSIYSSTSFLHVRTESPLTT